MKKIRKYPRRATAKRVQRKKKPAPQPKPYVFEREKFWEDPANSGASPNRIKTCRPEFYIGLENVTQLWVSTMERFAKKGDSILEIGCGTGRNLVALQEAGFERVSGIEISYKTVEVGREAFPEYKDIQVLIGPAEKMINEIDDVDVIFTSGLLMHIPPENEWLFAEIAKKARKLIMTNEGETNPKISEHAWNRDYKVIFEGLGWREVEMETGDKYPPQRETTIKRVFKRVRPRRARKVVEEAVPVEVMG